MGILNEVKNINISDSVNMFFINYLCYEDNFSNNKVKRNTQRMVFLYCKGYNINSNWRTDYYIELFQEREELNKIRRIKKQKSTLNELISVSTSKKRERL